jgi:hypothetical protein
MFWTNTSIARKLSLTFFTLLFLLTLTSALNLYFLDDFNNRITDLVSNDVIQLRLTARINRNVSDIIVQEQRLLRASTVQAKTEIRLAKKSLKDSVR